MTGPWMLLADLHLDQRTLPRAQPTLAWILEEHRRVKPSHVIFLGDTTNNRKGDLVALHAFKSLVDSMVDADFPCEVHLVIGNHDMSSLYDRRMSTPMIVAQDKAKIYAYPDVMKKTLDGVPVVFLSWHEDATEVLEPLATFSAAPDASETVVFGHLGLRTARLSGWNYGSELAGATDDTSVLHPQHFADFKHTFCGHYHTHCTYDGKVTYVGATMMQNFGDAHSEERGYVLYEPDSGNWAIERNPHAVHYVDVTCERVLRDRMFSSDMEQDVFKGKSVRLLTDERTAQEDESRALAALSLCEIWDLKVHRRVRSHRPLASSGGVDFIEDLTTNRVQPVDDQREFLNRMAGIFVSGLADAELQDAALEYMRGIIEGEVVEGSQAIFRADVRSVWAIDFLGIQGEKTFDFGALHPGLWMMTGPNGAGKSQVIDAIAWCLFKKTFRDVKIKEIANNGADGGGCSVTVRFANGVIVQRTLTSLRLTQPNGDAVQEGSLNQTQKFLEDHVLNCNWETFRRTVLLSSGDFLSLFSGNDNDRNMVIERLLGMSVLDKISAIVDEDASNVIDDQKRLTPQLIRVEEQSIRLETEHDRDLARSETERAKSQRAAEDLAEEETRAAREERTMEKLVSRREESRAEADKIRIEMDALSVKLLTATKSAACAASERSAAVKAHDEALRDIEELTKSLVEARENLTKKEDEFTRVEEDKQAANTYLGGLNDEMKDQEKNRADLRVRLEERRKETSAAQAAITDHHTATLKQLNDVQLVKRRELLSLVEQHQESMRKRKLEREKCRSEEDQRKQERLRKMREEETARSDVKAAEEEREKYRQRLYDYQSRRRRADELRDNIRRQTERLAIPAIIEKAHDHAKASHNKAIILGVQVDVIRPLQELHFRHADNITAVSPDETKLLTTLDSYLRRVELQGEPTTEGLKEMEQRADRVIEMWDTTRAQLANLDANLDATRPEMAPPADDEVEQLQHAIERLRGEIQSAEEEFKRERQGQFEELSAMKEECVRNEEETAKEVELVEGQCLSMKEKVEAAQRTSEAAQEQISGSRLELAAAKEKCFHLEESLKAAENRKASEDHLNFLREKETAREKEAAELLEGQDELRKREGAASATLQELEREIDAAQGLTKERTAAIAKLKADIEHAKEGLGRLSDDMGARATVMLELQGQLNKIRVDLQELEGRGKIRSLWKTALASTNDASAKSKSVREGKGSFRHLCRKQHLEFLQSRFEQNLALLNGGNWDPRLSCKLSDNLQFTQRNGETVAFNQRSSGEKQRTILALLFAITEALITHGSMRPMLLICDEVLDHLDTEGRQSVFRFLKDFCQRHPEHRVMIITHVSEDYPISTIRVAVDGPRRVRTYTALTAGGERVSFAT